MQNKEILNSIEMEMRKIKKENASWPDHVAAQAGYVANEAGNLVWACLQQKYNHKGYMEGDTLNMMKTSAVRTAAMAIRFLENLKEQ